MITVEQAEEIRFDAFMKMAKWIRQNPPADLENAFLKDPRLFDILVGGKDRDPEGFEYMAYFIKLAMEEMGLC